MTDETNLVLVGPMGAGKTSVGKLLAQQLNLTFFDADRELEARCGADIPWIFDIEGETGFRHREQDIIAELCQQRGIVLATGGGAVLREENRAHIRAAGVVVYLSANEQQILRRVSRDTNRPLLQVEDPAAAIRRILEERDPLYRQVADLVVCSSDSESPGSMAGKIKQQLREKFPTQFG